MIVSEFLSVLSLMLISSSSKIDENNKTKNYLKDEGKLVDYTNCQYDDEVELCNGVYEYTVNAVVYKALPNLLSNRSRFKEIAIVKYNPDNPSEYVMDSGWNQLMIVGVIMVIIIIIVIIDIVIFVIFINKASKKIKDIKTSSSNFNE